MELAMKRYLVLLGLWLISSFSAFAIADARVLRVAVAADNPPFASVADGKTVGIEIDLSRLLQVELGVQLQLQAMPSADVVPALERGDVDIVMAGLLATAELEKRVALAQPYLHSGEMAIIRTDDVMRFSSPAALLQEGLKVGEIAGSIGAEYVKTTMSHPLITNCVTADQCLQALLTRNIDVFIGSPAISWGLATDSRYSALMSLYRPLNEEYFVWATAKNNAQLRDRLDIALQHMQQLQMFEHILNRWIPVRVANE
jgi:polar amino acid transport system substrate-binding protein